MSQHSDELWVKSTTANSILLTLPATEAKTLKEYLHGKLSPKQAANEFGKNLDLDLDFNQYELAEIAYQAPDEIIYIIRTKANSAPNRGCSKCSAATWA